MTKRELSAHQQKIVRQYYKHLDTITLSRLQEIVSDLAVTDTPAKAERLWKRAEQALAKVGAEAAETRRVLESRDVGRLATLVGRLST